MTKKKALPVIVLLVVGGFFWWWFSRSQPFFYAGTLEATEVTLQPRVAGVVDVMHVHEGDTVSPGQTLVTLSAEDLRLAAASAESDYQRGRQLYQAGTLTQAALDQLTLKRDQTALMVTWTTITAPVGGVVLNRYREPGESVRPGVNLLTLGDLAEVWAFLYVPETLLPYLAIGQTVTGWVGDRSDQPLTGTISLIRDQAEFTPKNVQTQEERTRLVYGVKVRFANPDRQLKPGMTIQVKLPEPEK